MSADTINSDAISTLVRFAFEDMNMHKLRINVFDYNERAKHVLLSHGFVQEGKLERDFYRGLGWPQVPSDTFTIRPGINGTYARRGYTASGFYDPLRWLLLT